MQKSQIDSAALLGVVIASALALMLLPGAFAWLGSIGGLTLLFILLSFDREGYRSVFQSLAFAAVFGFCLALACSAPLEVLAGNGQLPPTIDSRVSHQGLPLLWVCATVIFWGIDRGRMSGRESLAAGGAPARTTGASYRTILSEPAAPPAAASSPAKPAVATPEPVPEFIPIEVPSIPTPPVSEPQPRPQVQPQLQPAPVPPPAAAPAPVPIPRSGKETMIYVTLLGEGLNVLRSVRAEHLGRDFYQIVDVMPEGETWEYQPGQVVRCKKKNLSSGKAWVAVEEAPRAS